MAKLKLKYKDSFIDIDIPDRNLKGVLESEDLPGVTNPRVEVKRALENPIGSPRLREIVRGKRNIVILASDITRPSPSHILIPPIVEELLKSNIKYENIKIVFGLGYHRKHTEEEKKLLVGSDIYKKIPCIDHDINDCVYLGKTSRGTPIEVFRAVAEADFVIATGNIEFHYKAGYSGGNKALLPGVTSKRTIEANHKMMIWPGTRPGVTEGNPMREDIEEGGRIGGVKFIVNAVLNGNKEIVKVVAGDPIKAHRQGAKYVDQMYKREISEKADIVIASCGGFPKDINLYQAQKGLENASYALKDAGSMILLAECKEGLGEKTFEEWMLRAKSPKDPIEWIRKEFKVGGHKAALMCQVLDRMNVYLLSSMEDRFVKDIFFHPIKSVQETLDRLLIKYGEDAKVIVIPAANSTVPRLKGKDG
ncbi:nickel-dependent lactate racemase family protein [Tepidimicrobium xylanilyticum]|uniref:nickel-dependent lactate racemase n=1 Tax=Tepidimicrobium xylanilyticum TaxID=1123352 RepID=UPI002651CC21|nr:nickel-dependent lactate racemase [Tepidimicrobium xylanilyticum]GMG95361.1 lactate racemase [Tepidimicrobium xylanilyticum]